MNDAGEANDAVEAAMSLYQVTAALEHGRLVPIEAELARRLVPRDGLLGTLDIRPTHIGRGACRAEMTVGPVHLNQRGVTQGGTLVSFADAAAGWASYAMTGSGGFTTIGLSCSLLRAARAGDRLTASATPVHLGRKTMVIGVTVVRARDGDSAESKPFAHVTCTQLVLG